MNSHLLTSADAVKRFVESHLLDMRWLDEYVSGALWRGGLDPATPLGTTSQLIVCTIVKLTLLLIVLSIIRGLLDRRFAPERGARALFGGGVAAALTGCVTGASLLKSAEATLPSRLAAMVRRGMVPEAAAALLFTAPFADPFTFTVVLTMAFGIRSALFCTISGGMLAVLGGVIIGLIRRQTRRSDDEVSAAEAEIPVRSADMPRLRELPGKVSAEIRYIFPCIVLGAGSGAFIRNWVPENWVQTILGTTDPWAVCLAAVAGIPFGADLFCMLPIVVELQTKGANPGILTAFILSATAFTPSALFAFKRAAEPKLLSLIYVLCLSWAAGTGCLLNALSDLFR